MLLDKEKVKKRITEYIIDSYYIKSAVQFKDIKEKFCAPPISLSSGTMVNYLNELVDENKIRKWREESNTFYGPRKISLMLKSYLSIIIISMLLIIISSILELYYNNNIIANIFTDIRFIYVIVGFDLGAGFICILWHQSTKAINTRNNGK